MPNGNDTHSRPLELSPEHRDALRHVVSPRTKSVLQAQWPDVLHRLISRILHDAQLVAERHLLEELARNAERIE